MGRRKQPPGYAAARRALSQHVYYHHDGATGLGTLANRLDQHEAMHLAAKLDHRHDPCGDGETDIEMAFRLLKEAREQHG